MRNISLPLFVILITVFTIYTTFKSNDNAFLNSQVKAQKKYLEPIDPVEYWTVLGSICALVPIGGIFSGLTIGLMSLDETNLNILKRSGTPQQQRYAERIEPIRKNTHLLLVTLLLGNTIVNETLPVLFHSIRLDGYQAVLMSTALILLFGEIIPQAICARHGLEIGAFFAWPVRILMALIFVVAWPVAKLLDWILGTHEGVIYRRAELRELVALHGEGPDGTLTKDEVGILRSVLEIRDKTVADVMTKMDSVFMLPFNAKMSREVLEQIMQVGHSRIPVYKGSRDNLIGVILVKQLILCDPSQETPLFEFTIRQLPFVKFDTPLFDILHIFEEGGSHMALIVEETSVAESTPLQSFPSLLASPMWTSKASPLLQPRAYRPLGIITLEDVIEELLGQEIIDETDVYVDVGSKVKVARVIRDLEKKFSSSKLFEKRDSLPSLEAIIEDENAPLLEDTSTPIYSETTKILSSMDLMDSIDSKKSKQSKKRRDLGAIVDAKDFSSPVEAVVYGIDGRTEFVSVRVKPEESRGESI